jgi:hypothetical protein
MDYNEEYWLKISNISKAIHRNAMERCVIVINRCLHTLERDEEVQRNFFDNEVYYDYNKWKSKYCKKSLYFFSLDRSIV